MTKINNLSDYDDYRDLCDQMGERPKDIIDEEFYQHWYELLKQQHQLNFDDLEEFYYDDNL